MSRGLGDVYKRQGISCGYIDNTFLLVFLGTMTGVGGGLLRDTMAGVAPYIFVKHIYACASIAGAWICVIIYRSYGELPAMVVSSLIVMLIRFLAAHYRWNLPRIGAQKSGKARSILQDEMKKYAKSCKIILDI